MVAQWLEWFPHIMGSNPPCCRALLRGVCMFSPCSTFTPELVALRLIGDSKLYIGVNVSKKSCHSVLALQRVCNLPGVYPHHHTLTHHT